MLYLHDLCCGGATMGNWSIAWCPCTRLCLPLPKHLSDAAPVPLHPMVSSTVSGSQPGSNTPVAPVVMSRPPAKPTTDSVVDSKVGIDVVVCRVAEKRKVVQVMS